MPRGDRTGPWGFGPMTGRGAGYCAGYPTPGYANPAPGRSWFGRGRRWSGFGGWRNWYRATGLPGWARAQRGLPAWGIPYFPELTPEEEKTLLEEQANFLKQQLEAVKNRLANLSKSEKEESEKEESTD